MEILSDLEPKSIFRNFEKICSIPHGSSDTKAISDFLVSFAKRCELEYIQDESNNTIIYKSGTKGYEESPPVILQGHLDMVCEKEKNASIDFHEDGLELEHDSKKIWARGTTLGADDGIAIAYIMSILESEDIPHPPIEAVLTADEEIGMLGATSLDTSKLKSKLMINIDSEEEGYILAGCAGGIRATCHFPVIHSEIGSDNICLEVLINGLTGGHSGTCIDEYSANSNMLMGRFLYDLSTKLSFNIIEINGGLQDNAIPRETLAVIEVSMKDYEHIKILVDEYKDILFNEYNFTDPDINIEIGMKDECQMAMSSLTTKTIITALFNLPNGIERVSKDVNNMVETSLNLGILETEDNEVVMSFSIRSSYDSKKKMMANKVESLTNHLGGYVTYEGDYASWEYKKDSPLRNKLVEVYEKLYQKKPIIQTIHAGLECGIFTNKIEGLDCVSIGPDMDAIHTTSEVLYIESTKRTWLFLLELLKELK